MYAIFPTEDAGRHILGAFCIGLAAGLFADAVCVAAWKARNRRKKPFDPYADAELVARISSTDTDVPIPDDVRPRAVAAAEDLIARVPSTILVQLLVLAGALLILTGALLLEVSIWSVMAYPFLIVSVGAMVWASVRLLGRASITHNRGGAATGPSGAGKSGAPPLTPPV